MGTIPNLPLWRVVFLVVSVLTASCESCGPQEEGASIVVSCSTDQEEYDDLELYIEIDGVFHPTAGCNSDEFCTSRDLTMYTASYGELNGRKQSVVTIAELNRTITGLMCYIDDVPLEGTQCGLTVYKKAITPVCEGPVFEDDNSVAKYTCNSDSIYPSGRCTFRLTSGSNQGLNDINIVTTNIDSTTSEGDQAVSCELDVQVTGSRADEYQFSIEITPSLSEILPASATVFSELSPLALMPTTLSDPGQNDLKFESYGEDDRLVVTIPVFGNPSPHLFSLVAGNDNTSLLQVTADSYTVSYQVTTASEAGVVTLEVTKTSESDNGVLFYAFTAENGVLDGPDFEFRFSVGTDDGSDDGDGDGDVEEPTNSPSTGSDDSDTSDWYSYWCWQHSRKPKRRGGRNRKQRFRRKWHRRSSRRRGHNY